jgi:hypothetical protein
VTRRAVRIQVERSLPITTPIEPNVVAMLATR